MSSICGMYFDPNHGACVRMITQKSTNVYTVTGVYGEKELRPKGEVWEASIRMLQDHFLVVDFFGKTTKHAQVYRALWCPDVREIHWQDGNVWKQMYS